ncbi:uncharacterized protein [Amphiura filiformis]|uniref:uncharacterized protein isoform X1 n=1 Tax=Amphiura filiformis TaxID=82378 RepID=UPI003B2192D1
MPRLYLNMMDKMILNLGVLLMIVVLGKNIASASRVTTDPVVFVQRNTEAELKCGFKYKKAVSSVTWKKGETYDDAVEVIKYFMGWKTGPKFNKGYDLADDNSTLIIKNVGDEDAGTWWCTVVVTDPWTDRSSTNVTVTVPPIPPTITQCPNGDPCEIKVDKDETNYTVTCTASGSRPAVTLILYQDNKN